MCKMCYDSLTHTFSSNIGQIINYPISLRLLKLYKLLYRLFRLFWLDILFKLTHYAVYIREGLKKPNTSDFFWSFETPPPTATSDIFWIFLNCIFLL